MKRQDLSTRRDELQERILLGALAAFADHGLFGASTQAIADQCGISKTKLHYYISSKEDLYRDVLQKILQDWSKLQEGIPTDEGPAAYFSAYISRKVEFSFEHPLEVKVFTSEVMRGAPYLREIWVDSRSKVGETAQLIQRWIDSGQMKPVDPILFQFHVWAITELYANIKEEVNFMSDDSNAFSKRYVTDQIKMLLFEGILIG